MPNHPGFKPLNSDQKPLIAKELERAVLNRRYADSSDLDRAASMFYHIACAGFQISGQIDEILNQSQGWSSETLEELNTLADSSENIVMGIYQTNYKDFVTELKSKDH